MTRCPAMFTLVALMCALCPRDEARAQKPADPPATIAPDSVRATKQATVMLKVSTATGRTAEGSGFFALEPGIVVTNAHVLGMLRADSKPPTKVEVIVGSGTANELKLVGTVLGVDRASDLALLKVDAKPGAKLPAPLKFGNTDDLVETQKVYIFGFAFGSDLGKNITVSESSISSLRTNPGGALAQIQVNGGMHPGNSGGPVVDTRGEVVGVSVSVVRNTQINFAVPAPSAQALFNGSVLDWTVGVAYREGTEARLPLRLPCLDPLSRVREVRVEVWAGKPSDKRVFNPKDDKPQPGDGPRRSVALKYAQSAASGDVPLPKLAAGEVAWVQLVLVPTKGDLVRVAPRAFAPERVLERVAAELSAKPGQQKERTVRLKATQALTLASGHKRFVLARTAELPLTETFDPKGAALALGAPALGHTEDGVAFPPGPEVVRAVQQVPRFAVDETGARAGAHPDAPLDRAGEYVAQICTAYELATVALPNKQVPPGGIWRAERAVRLQAGLHTEMADLATTYLFEGVRSGPDGPEALVAFKGTVKGRTTKERLEGRVTGRFALNTERGFVSWVQLTIVTELATTGGELEALLACDVELTRTAAAGAAVVAKKEAKGLFAQPAASKEPTTYMKLASEKGDTIGQGNTYDFPGDRVAATALIRGGGLEIRAGEWTLRVNGPKKAALEVGEYADAKRWPFNGDAPGLSVTGLGRGSNTITGAFVIWELEIKDEKVVKLAVDFVQHSEGKPPALRGKVRINSSFE